MIPTSELFALFIFRFVVVSRSLLRQNSNLHDHVETIVLYDSGIRHCRLQPKGSLKGLSCNYSVIVAELIAFNIILVYS